jgi:hypothetical protein
LIYFLVKKYFHNYNIYTPITEKLKKKLE